MPAPTLRPKVGGKIGADLTVLAPIDTSSSDPVYLVWHRQAWCPMACKLYSSSRRSRREARILSKLSHPNTVRFLGLSHNGGLLTEFLEGPSLRRLIDDQANGLDLSDAMRIAVHIGAALQHVHDKGYLHLDVKPSNIIIARGRPVLFDFDCARRLTGPRPPHVAGTDPYIAPEECLRRRVTSASDMFSFGVLLYEMVTAKLPFPAGTKRRPYPQIHTDPVPIRRRRPSIPAALANLIESCLAREPAARPTLASLLPELNGFIANGARMWPDSFNPASKSAPLGSGTRLAA